VLITAALPDSSWGIANLIRERCADQKIFTVDQDATIIESRKREALYTYEGSRGYQPMLAVWVEMDVVLAEEFRDGNVPAQMAPLTVAKAAFAAALKTVTNYYYRGDSACHENKLKTIAVFQRRLSGPMGSALPRNDVHVCALRSDLQFVHKKKHPLACSLDQMRLGASLIE
jgi:hypothetical protein